MKAKEKTATEVMIDQLNGAEEVLAALDQNAGKIGEIPQVMLRCYSSVKAIMDDVLDGWNGDLNPGEQKIYRCQYAEKPYHTDADGPCDVWSTDEVCSLHIQRAEDQMAAREAL